MHGRVVFAGMDSEFSTKPLCALLDAGVEVAGIVRGNRGKRLSTSFRRSVNTCFSRHVGLKRVARRNGIPFFDVDEESQGRFVADLAGLQPDLLCVASFPCLLKEEVLRILPRGAVNMHPSMLPYYPGPNPYVPMIIHGEERWGVTIHAIDRGEDTGPIIRQQTIDYSPDDSGEVLHKRLIERGSRLIVESVLEMLSGECIPRPQPHVADRRRGKRLKKGEPTIVLKESAWKTRQFLNQLLFFAKPQLLVEDNGYVIRRVLRHVPKSTGITKVRIDVTSRLFVSKLRCRFPDGELWISARKTSVQS